MSAFDREAVRKELAGGEGGVLEQMARGYGVPVLELVKLLPPEQCTLIENPPITDVLAELSRWGELMIILQTPRFVTEIVSAIPPATVARGYFNFQKGTPFGGHLKEDAVEACAFLDRGFLGRRSLSLAFYDSDGHGIFKVFVRRDEKRELLTEQVAQFEGFRARLSASQPAR